MKLKEGERYDFLVEKTIRMGENDYYLLKGPSGVKYLLSQKHYSHYGIEVKGTVNCRVDKINCRGEVFLEPANPFYEEGKVYDFKIRGRDVRVNEDGELTPVLLLDDKSGNELIMPINKAGNYDPEKTDHVSLPVKKINKGRIILTASSEKTGGERIEEDRLYEFFIYDRKKGLDGKDYFLIRDQNNSHHIIPADQYSYYGLETGKPFRGRFIRYHATGKYKIEPLNPYYKPGEVYEFDLLSESIMPADGGKLLIVADKHGLRHEVHVPGDYSPGKKLYLRVEKIRKGWPLLIPAV
ncbi:MAG: hypothetical protein U5K32_12175 [Bacteroidales bacterium]|nr:hypothetical protein [Bacteroidales bacterium]